MGLGGANVQLRELASGVDALYLSGRSSLGGALLDRLEAARLDAGERNAPVPFDLGGYGFEMAPRALLKYRYRLDHPAAVIGLTASTNLPTFRVQARSEALHSLGPDGVLSWLSSIVANEGLPVGWKVSRIDLHADWQGWDLTGDERHRFVCRARDLDTHENSADLKGFSFGNRKSGSVLGRIYDKTREIAGNGHDWWLGLWGPAYVEGTPVLRVEFEFQRQCLREMRLDSPSDVLAASNRLWAYATQEWLTYHLPTAHQRASRWPLAPEWEAVQAASLAGNAIPMDRIRAGAARGGLRRIMPGVFGYLTSFAAHVNVETLADALDRLPGHVRAYERMANVDFTARVREKRRDMP